MVKAGYYCYKVDIPVINFFVATIIISEYSNVGTNVQTFNLKKLNSYNQKLFNKYKNIVIVPKIDIGNTRIPCIDLHMYPCSRNRFVKEMY